MKAKILAAVAIATFASFAFAEDFTVKAVKGSVKAGSDVVKAGQTLQSDTKLTAGLNSSLTVVGENGQTIVIKGKSTGTVANLVAKASGGLRKGSLNTTTIAGNTKGGSSGVATASSRASEAKEDTEWAE